MPPTRFSARPPRPCPAEREPGDARRLLGLVVVALFLFGGFARAGGAAEPPARWSAEKARQWQERQPWLVGCNFIPSTAANQLEMWQTETFDPDTIDRELGWAAGVGFNAVRTYLHDLAWQTDPDGFKRRIDTFLSIAAKRGIRPMLVIFDDCWNADPKAGPQPPPVPGVHNSRWLQSPGKAVVNDPGRWDRLRRYVEDVVGTFGRDERVLAWDLYNEPGASGQGAKSLPLLEKAFAWARAAGPSQPLTAGIWHGNKVLNDFQLAASDIVTFHNYGPAGRLKQQIARLKAYGRPVICTEWMRRPTSTIATHLPIFKAEGVGCLMWGLVAGKTQTIYPWGSKPGAPEPPNWFHDLLRPDGSPYRPTEVALLRRLTGRPPAPR